MNKNNRKNLFILSFTLLVVMLGYSMAMPLLPFYIERFGFPFSYPMRMSLVFAVKRHI